ncbi:hypothetical protein SEA_JETBLADE_72 [Mycobacterium phage JetBlade]|uniref:Uncharacterized protein n=1 Tax=Mycobacterium phage JetBlade TaxID=2041534 RepID=A0A2D1GCT8_9CAUD|nr:hypothetical protein SEA_JETBLADE_72 [Mycobacterium phage JetBlade]
MGRHLRDPAGVQVTVRWLAGAAPCQGQGLTTKARCRDCPWESRATTARALGIAVRVHETTGHRVKVREA